jgi:hypothetical protein
MPPERARRARRTETGDAITETETRTTVPAATVRRISFSLSRDCTCPASSFCVAVAMTAKSDLSTLRTMLIPPNGCWDQGMTLFLHTAASFVKWAMGLFEAG